MRCRRLIIAGAIARIGFNLYGARTTVSRYMYQHAAGCGEQLEFGKGALLLEANAVCGHDTGGLAVVSHRRGPDVHRLRRQRQPTNYQFIFISPKDETNCRAVRDLLWRLNYEGHETLIKHGFHARPSCRSCAWFHSKDIISYSNGSPPVVEHRKYLCCICLPGQRRGARCHATQLGTFVAVGVSTK